MKEQVHLTRSGENLYPGVRRDLFMAENQGEGVRLPEVTKGGGPPPKEGPEAPRAPSSSISPQSTSPELKPGMTPVPAKQIEAREAWGKFVGGRELAPDEEWAVKMGISPEGSSPVAGGAPPAEHYESIKGKTPGSPEELAEIQRLIIGDREHIFSPNDLATIPDPTISARIEARAPEVVSEIVKTISTGDHIPDYLLYWIARYPEYTDQFITRVIMTPFTTPSVDYELEGFYARTNLSSLIETIEAQDRRRGVSEEENRGRHYRILFRAVQYYHHMNRVVNSGQIEQYAQISPHFPTEFFDEVKKIPGVASAKRLYEIGYRLVTEEDGGVNNTNFPKVQRLVERWLNEENNSGVLKTSDTSPGAAEDAERPLRDWEIKRASDLARSMLTIEFRTAEQISMGELALVESYASSPQESATRLTDWFRRMGFKFTIDEVQGGMNVMTRTKEKFRILIDRKYPWLKRKNLMRLKKIQNVSVDDLELAGIFGVRGVWDGYRLDIGVLDQIVVEIGEKKVSIFDFFNDKKDSRMNLMDVVGLDRAEAIKRELLSGKILTGKKREQFRTKIIAKETTRDPNTGLVISEKGKIKDVREFTVKDVFEAAKRVASIKGIRKMNEILEEVCRPLVDKTTVGLGAMLTSGALRHPNLYHVKEMIWEKVVDYDPLVIASMLSKLEFREGIPRTVRSLDEILREHGFGEGEKDDRWKQLRSKLIITHEKRMGEALGPTIVERPRGGRLDCAVRLDLTGLDDTERAVVNSIREEGQNITQDLSFIRFPYGVFFDDLPFEETSYKEMGPEFFRRRQGSDLPAFAEGQKGWATLVGKAAQLNPEERIKQFEAIIDAVSVPLGVEGTQDYVVDSLFEADCEFIKQYGWAQQFIVDGLMEFANRPTSQAQEYGGTKAPALNTYEMADYLNAALNHGVLRKAGRGEIKIGDQIILEAWDDTYMDFRRRTKSRLINLILAVLKDLFIGALLTAPWGFGKSVVKEKF